MIFLLWQENNTFHFIFYFVIHADDEWHVILIYFYFIIIIFLRLVCVMQAIHFYISFARWSRRRHFSTHNGRNTVPWPFRCAGMPNAYFEALNLNGWLDGSP